MTEQKPRMIEIKADDREHHSCEKTPTQDIVCATLDTALRLLREGAAKLVIQSLRDNAQIRGVPFPAADDEFVQQGREDGEPDCEVYEFGAYTRESLLLLEQALTAMEWETRQQVAQVVQDKIDLDSL